MCRPLTSVISTAPRERLVEMVARNSSIRGILIEMGYTSFGSQPGRLTRRLQKEGIDLTDLRVRAEALRRKKFREFRAGARVPDSLIFCACSTYQRSGLREIVISRKLLPYKCAACPIKATHNGLPISLHLDHKNGINNDHRKSNLRWLCPNCHSQTSTYAGKRREPKPPKGPRRSITKIQWPEPFAVGAMLKLEPATIVAKRLGVSDIAVTKFCKKHGIHKPGRGYWTKLRAAPTTLKVEAEA